jgi:SAM-dependent methyltransferase
MDDNPTKPAYDMIKGYKDARNCGLRDAYLSGWYRHDTSEILEGFDIPAGETVVDVGCGDGEVVSFALDCGANVIACDIDGTKVEGLEARLKPAHGDALQTLVSDSDPLQLDDGIAARVIAMEVLEHVDDPPRFLSELVRIGKPGSLYLIAVPDAAGERVQKKLAPPSYWQKPNHLHIFTRQKLDELIEAAGLVIERRVHYSFFWAMWWAMFWISDCELGDPDQGPLLNYWTKTWTALMDTPGGERVHEALNDVMPKSQVIIARKPDA